MADVTMAEIRAFYPGLGALADGAAKAEREEVDPDTAEWLDGPQFVRWLREIGFPAPVYPNVQRRITNWQHGAAVSVRVADEVCVLAGRNLADLPDAFWRSPPRHGGKRTDPRIRLAAVNDLDRGEPLVELAARYRVAESSIRRWSRMRPEIEAQVYVQAETLSGRAQMLRMAAGLDRPSAVKRMGLDVTPSTVYSWERDGCIPEGPKAIAYAAFLDELRAELKKAFGLSEDFGR